MSTQLKIPVNKLDHLQGSATAPVELVEYGDFQCPSCGDSYAVVEKVIREFGKKLVFVFRNFPLTDIHPDAFDAALAAEAAALQNKFWEMYDLLFRNQERLSPQDLLEYAKEINLDIGKFEQEIQIGALTPKIEADIESGLRSDVNGTPTFFINGEKYEGDWEGDGLIKCLKKLL